MRVRGISPVLGLSASMLFCAAAVFSQENTADVALSSVTAAGPAVEAAAPVPGPESRKIRLMDFLNRNLSDVNVFFVDLDRDISGSTAAVVNKSGLVLRLGAYVSEGESVKVTPRADLRVDLPNTLKRLKLVVQYAPDRDRTLSDSEERIASGQSESEGTTIGAQYSLFSLRGLRQFVRLGIKARVSLSKPLTPFAKTHLSSLGSIGESWRTNSFIQAAWFSERPIRLSGGFYLNRSLPRRATLSLNSSAEKRTDAGNISILESLGVMKQLSGTDSAGISVRMLSRTAPTTRAENYTIGLFYRRSLYEDWFFAEISPALVYPRERNFTATPEVGARLSMYFGRVPGQASR